ncbi:MAG: crotonase/enoyl-CoA hydratase family protein [Rhizobiales bacterium]|nr:crotonase/enoyl-CoA hydratase family protein [Hyphomicrobiales bacterium]
MAATSAQSRLAQALPRELSVQFDGDIAVLKLSRPDKRNALNNAIVRGLENFFIDLPDEVKAVVVHGEGEHFSAGLDLSSLTETDFIEGYHHSRMWHYAFERIEFGKAPVVSVLHGAVVGGGLELACATHIRVAEKSAYYALPEGSRGIYVGGGGSVRIPRLIGTAKMMDMMLTGRVFGAEDGQQMGISNYLVENGDGLAKGIELAKRIAENAPLTNFAITNVLPRIAEFDTAGGYVVESIISSVASSGSGSEGASARFFEKRGPKVVR